VFENYDATIKHKDELVQIAIWGLYFYFYFVIIFVFSIVF